MWTLPAPAWTTLSWPSSVQPSWHWEVTYLRSSAVSPLISPPSLHLQFVCRVPKPSSPLEPTWGVAPLCPGLVLRLLVFLASLPTCLLLNSWLGLLSFLLLGLYLDKDPCLGAPSHRCLLTFQPLQVCQAISLHVLKFLNLLLHQSDPPPQPSTASRPQSPATPLHNTTLSRLQPPQATRCPHRWVPIPNLCPNQACQSTAKPKLL